jgi:hypothetical protein
MNKVLKLFGVAESCERLSGNDSAKTSFQMGSFWDVLCQYRERNETFKMSLTGKNCKVKNQKKLIKIYGENVLVQICWKGMYYSVSKFK